MRFMAGLAPVDHAGMLEDIRSGLCRVAASAEFTGGADYRSPGRAENIRPVGFVAVHAVHPSLDYRMVVGKLKFRMLGDMAVEAGRGILSRVDDQPLCLSPGGHMETPRAMAALTSGLSRLFNAAPFSMKLSVGAGGENPGQSPMAAFACLVADKFGRINSWSADGRLGAISAPCDQEQKKQH
jgi:hypothetical protein